MLTLAGATGAHGQTLTFEGQAVGAPPEGMTCALTGGGAPGVWRIQRDSGPTGATLVLAQTDADATRRRFPHCIVDGIRARDLTLSVRFKPVSGGTDRSGGLVWRYRDAGNYYVVRANALEGNVVLYKFVDGVRSDLRPKGAWFMAYGKKANVPSGAWSVLRVAVTGSLFDVSLNGQALFQVEDATFPEAGRVGVWTKADSVTCFDDLTIAVAR